MSGIPPIASPVRNTAAASRANDRATLAISRAMQEAQREAEGLVRLLEQASSGKGRHVDYRA